MSEFHFGNYGGLGDVDVDRGMVILGQFQDAMKSLYPDYEMTLDDLISKYEKNILGLGLAANVAGMSDSDTQVAMVKLARAGNGKIPATWNGLVSALSDKATTISWTDAIVHTVEDSASDIATGAEKVRTTIINTANTALDVASVARYLMWPALALFAYSMWKNRDDLSTKMYRGATQAAGGAFSLAGTAIKRAAGNPKRRR